MALSNNELKPGHLVLHPCPECGADWVGRRHADGNGSDMEYYCEACGYKPAKDEVQKSPLEIFDDGFNQVVWPNSSHASVDQITDSELQTRVEDKLAEGWELTEVSPSGTKAILTRTKGGSFLAHLITLLFTFATLGMGNYFLHRFEKRRNRETLVLRASDTTTSSDPEQHQNPSQRLQQLEDLYDDGVLTDEEYQEKRKKIINEF